MNKFSMNIKLTAKQVKMYNALNNGRYREVLFYGSSRSGKTFLILFWMIVQCVVFKANCLIARATFASLSTGMIAQTLPAVLNTIAKFNGVNDWKKLKTKDGAPFAVFNGKFNTLTFFNGSYIQFASMRGSADSETSYDKILSTEWGHIFVDEISEVDEKSIDILRTRLAQKLDVRNKLVFALNPTSKTHWSYKRFFLHEDRDGVRLTKETVSKFLIMHFSVFDNLENVSDDYAEDLNQLSALQRKRFLEGIYVDESEGEIFKKITWGNIPPARDFTQCLIYTDPSAKEQRTNDFKASVLLGVANAKIWVIAVRAVQGTSRQMTENIHELYMMAPIAPKVVMEKKQLPLDFQKTFDQYQIDTGWTCPLVWDTRDNGDKFTHIEATLEPLFATERIIFNEAIKDSGYGSETVNQFLYFSKKVQKDRKDDIPDATAKGVSLLNRSIVKKPVNNERRSAGLLINRGTRTDLN